MLVAHPLANTDCSDDDKLLRYSRSSSMCATLPIGNVLSIPAGHLPRGKREYDDAVEKITDHRRKRLKELIDKRYDGRRALFAGVVDVAPSYVSRLLSDGRGRKGLGEDLARRFERKCQLENGWFDMDFPVEDIPDMAHGWPFKSIRPARYYQLQKNQKKLIQGVVEHMIAEFESVHDVRPKKSRAG